MRFLAVICVATLMVPAASAATVHLETQDEALAWIDSTFAANKCQMSKSAFSRQMELDGVAPTVNDMARPMDGSLKIIKQRRVLAALKGLFDQGLVCEDAGNGRIAISKFGGCRS